MYFPDRGCVHTLLTPWSVYASDFHCVLSCLCVCCQISYGLLQFDYFVCPIDYDEVKGALSMECERSFAFRLHEYSVPWFIHSIGALVRMIICYNDDNCSNNHISIALLDL